MKESSIFFFSKECKSSNSIFLNQIESLQSSRLSKEFYFYKRNKDVAHPKKSIFINSVYPKNYKFSFEKFWLFLTNYLRTLKLLGKKRPSVVFACDIYTFIMLSLALKLIIKKRIKLVYLIEINFYQSFKGRGFFYRIVLQSVFNYLLNGADNLVFLSNDLAIFTIKKFKINPKKTIVIPYSIDIESIKKNREKDISLNDKQKLESGSFKIFSIGRLDKQKDFFTIIKAFSLVSGKNPDAQFFVIGDGDQKEKFLNSKEYKQLKSKIHMLGWQKNIFSYLKYADLFLFSSFFEGFGLILVEVMASGVPIIATDSPFGPSEILERGRDGILVQVGDYEAMANGVEKIFKNRKLKEAYVKNAIERSKRYKIGVMLKKYNSFFQNLTLYEKE